MRILFLGTGTSHGVPVIGCHCPVCTSSNPHDRRMRSSILIEDGDTAVVIDTGCEFRLQALGAGITHLDGVLYTHAHADHLMGLDDLRVFSSSGRFPIYGFQSVLDSISRIFPYAFQTLPYKGAPQLERNTVGEGEQFSVGSIVFTAIPVMHGMMRIAGYRFGSAAYLTDVSDILWDEIKATIPALGICFVVIAIIHDGIALRLYPKAFFQYFCYSVQYLAFGLMVLLCGIFAAAFLVLLQKSAEHVKGRVPRRGIYVTSVLAKCVFVIFIVFFLSIAVRNAFTAYNTVQTSQYLADKIAGYVTVPVNINNASSQGLEENYKEFYAATVERYHGILIDASNYEYDLISGETPEEAYGQDSITVNINYLDFNPIYDGTGKQITESMLSNSAFNVLIPASKSNVESRYREYVETAYGKQPNFITYDDGNSHIYSYNANIGTGGNGELDSPVILVAGEDDLEGIFVLSYCSSGSYILNVPESDPYQKLLPLLRETGIAPVTLDTPPVSDTFTDTIRQQSSMLVLYGGQSVILLAGLIGLILFSARLFCENYRKRIAASLIEGSTVLSCIRGHLIVTVLYYCTAVIAVSVLSLMMQVTLNQYILIVAFLAEIIITYRICRKNAHQNLYQIVKGAE